MSGAKEQPLIDSNSNVGLTIRKTISRRLVESKPKVEGDSQRWTARQYYQFLFFGSGCLAVHLLRGLERKEREKTFQ